MPTSIRLISGPAAAGLALFCALALGVGGAPTEASDHGERARLQVQRIQDSVDGPVVARFDRATGVARLLRFTPASVQSAPDKSLLPSLASNPDARARVYLEQYGAAFGLGPAADELDFVGARSDVLGSTRVDYRQTHKGVAVFGGDLRVHFDAEGRLKAIHGTVVPDVTTLDISPRVNEVQAQTIATTDVAAQTGRILGLRVAQSRLIVFRENLLRGGAGANRLAWEVEVSALPSVREFVYVDAHKGDIIERITGIHDALDRQIYDGGLGPEFLVWSEGDALPTADVDIDNLVNFAEDTYNVFSSMTNGTYLSFDGVGAPMLSINNSPFIGCPNASWNGTNTNYCSGVTADDTVAHEWGHAYTERTHGLIYQWQPGALNESYSDIWGEVVDLLNGDGLDAPLSFRTVGECSTLGRGPSPNLTLEAPVEIAGSIFAAGAVFNPTPPLSVSGDVEVVFDGNGDVADGCESLLGFTAGNIALIDRGNCNFVSKVLNAQNAGAVGVLIVNSNEGAFTMSGTGSPTIPALMVGSSQGETIRNASGTPSVTITLGIATETSYRWLAGEDDPAFGGAIRDMWDPTCYGDPGKVTDGEYQCSTGDSGGVHSNSGVPNHAFALLIDGGTYNGVTVPPISLTKASHIYWRAQLIYQIQTSGFADHADALAMACEDLIGAPLHTPTTESPVGVISGETISSVDCAAVDQAIAAVELLLEPTQCNFEPLLANPAPPLCETGTALTIASNDFESGLDDWTVGTRAEVNPATFDTPDWSVVGDLPSERSGSAAFVPDLRIGNCQDDTEAGVLFLESPDIVLPAGIDAAQLAFEQWISTEIGWDGGNLKISVNGGAWTLVPAEAFSFNAYPQNLNNGDNPLSGEPAFTGTDGGSLLGSWGQSQADLSSLASPGDTVRLRYEMGLDGCNGVLGWYVDDVSIYTCAACFASDWYQDNDGDSFGNPEVSVAACTAPDGFVADSSDCNDSDGAVFSTPGEASALIWSGPQSLAWDSPVDPGGVVYRHDVLRTSDPTDFDASGICAEAGSVDNVATEPAVPNSGETWYYLVRTQNACPNGSGPIGTSSAGVPRTALSCL